MDWGEGDTHKFQYALHLSAGLGAMALASGDVLSIGLLQEGRLAAEFGPTPDRSRFHVYLDFWVAWNRAVRPI